MAWAVFLTDLYKGVHWTVKLKWKHESLQAFSVMEDRDPGYVAHSERLLHANKSVFSEPPEVLHNAVWYWTPFLLVKIPPFFIATRYFWLHVLFQTQLHCLLLLGQFKPSVFGNAFFFFSFILFFLAQFWALKRMYTWSIPTPSCEILQELHSAGKVRHRSSWVCRLFSQRVMTNQPVSFVSGKGKCLE